MSDQSSEKAPGGGTTDERPPKASRVRKGVKRPTYSHLQRIEVLKTVAYGSTVKQAADAAGIDVATLYDWMREHTAEYGEMCRAAWKASMARFPELCAKAMSIVAEKMDKLDAFSAAKVLNEILSAWEKGKAIDASADGSTGAGSGRPSSPLADAIRAIGDALRSQRGPA